MKEIDESKLAAIEWNAEQDGVAGYDGKNAMYIKEGNSYKIKEPTVFKEYTEAYEALKESYKDLLVNIHELYPNLIEEFITNLKDKNNGR